MQWLKLSNIFKNNNFLFLLALFVFFANGAYAQSVAEENPYSAPNGWQFEGIEGEGNFFFSADDISLFFDGDTAFGYGGVNKYSLHILELDSEQGILRFSQDIVLTKMAGAPELMIAERFYLDALRKVYAFKIEGDVLFLEYDIGRLHFRKRDEECTL